MVPTTDYPTVVPPTMGSPLASGWHVTCLRQESECLPYVTQWNALSGDVPFRRWEWLGAWWRHFGRDLALHVLLVTDPQGQVRGIAPWYQRPDDHSIRCLGDGKACSEYPSILTNSESCAAVAKTLASWLTRTAQSAESRCWTALEFEAVATDDVPLSLLLAELRQRRCAALERPGPSAYVLSLPSSVEAYVAARSKSNRHTLRRLQHRLACGEQSFCQLTRPEQLDEERWNLFVDLHQLRRATRQEVGCFEFPNFEPFLRDATRGLMECGMGSLLFAYDGSTPMAVCHLLHNRSCTYMYQSGMDPGVTEKHPGFVANALSVFWTIERGAASYDFLRGDEPYKQRWKAEPVTTRNILVSPPGAAARWRHQWVTAGAMVKDLVKSGLTATGLR